MSRQGAVTFKGNPMTLSGEEVAVGSPAPDFSVHFFLDGMQTLSLEDLKGKPTILSVVPSLDTGVCAVQTKRFNQELADRSDVNSVTVSMDLPFAQGRFCGENEINNMRFASDYQDRSFGENYGVLIEELKLLARAVFVLDAAGKVVHAEVCKEVVDEPDYDSAMKALDSLA